MADTTKVVPKSTPKPSPEFRVKALIRHPRTLKPITAPSVSFRGRLYSMSDQPQTLGIKTAIVPNQEVLKAMYDSSKNFANYIDPPKDYTAPWAKA